MAIRPESEESMKNKFELEHIGINTPNPEEAEKLAQLLSMMFNLEPATVRNLSLEDRILSV